MSAPIDPEVVERMVALVRALTDVTKDSPLGQSGYASEARFIVALLPEPVDPDLVEAQELAKSGAGDFVTSYPPARLERLTTHIYAAIKRGRELERSTHLGQRGEGR